MKTQNLVPSFPRMILRIIEIKIRINHCGNFVVIRRREPYPMTIVIRADLTMILKRSSINISKDEVEIIMTPHFAIMKIKKKDG